MNIIILGAQASGKGTQADIIAKKYCIPHISTGDMLRNAAENKTAFGLKAQDYLLKGELVPDKITIGIVKERLEQPDCENGFVLDGFPRNLEQAKALDEFADIEFVLELGIPDIIAVERISKRRVCSKCQATYIHEQGVDSCEKCGGKLVQRSDDKPEAIRKRLAIYHDWTEPLLEYYKPRNIVHQIDGTKSIQEVFNQIVSVLGE